jgi:hypothetical protein
VSVSSRYPRLFDLAYDKNITVEKVFSSDFQMLTFRKRLLGDLASDFNKMIGQCKQIVRPNYDDKVSWSLGRHGFLLKLYTEKVNILRSQFPSNSYGKPCCLTKLKFSCG